VIIINPNVEFLNNLRQITIYSDFHFWKFILSSFCRN